MKDILKCNDQSYLVMIDSKYEFSDTKIETITVKRQGPFDATIISQNFALDICEYDSRLKANFEQSDDGSVFYTSATVILDSDIELAKILADMKSALPEKAKLYIADLAMQVAQENVSTEDMDFAVIVLTTPSLLFQTFKKYNGDVEKAMTSVVKWIKGLKSIP